MTTQTIRVDITPGGVPEKIRLSQYDHGSRTIVINLFEGQTAFEIPTGAQVSIMGTKADNTGFQYECTYSGNTVTADTTAQMTMFEGEVLTELCIMDSTGENRLGTANFILVVEPAALKSDIYISDTDLPMVQEAAEASIAAKAAAIRAEAAAASATASETAASGSATSAAESATAAAGSAASAGTSETNAASSATAAAGSATDAAASATSASGSATSAAGSASDASTAAGNAAASATAAGTSETNAASSATAAAGSASDAAQSASSAGTSATNAATSESNASTSASNAATSASNASTSETNAANSATAAAGSASDASGYATTASGAATNAAASATAASGSATAASNSQSDAEAWAVGERGGTPVAPSDPTYQNSAKYWAQSIAGAAQDMQGATAQAPGVHGLAPAPVAGEQNEVLHGDAQWRKVQAQYAEAVDTNGVVGTAGATVDLQSLLDGISTGGAVADMTGATAQAAGTHGLAPAPAAGSQTKVLHGDATWKTLNAANAEATDTDGVLGTVGATVGLQSLIDGIEANVANTITAITDLNTEVGGIEDVIEDLAEDIAPAEVSPAEAAHSIGEQITYNGVLYTVTAAIAIGDTLTVGTNIAASDSLADQIGQVNSDLSDKQPKTLATAQTIGGTSRTTVEAALGALADSAYLEDTLTSSSAVKALTAKQGKTLKDTIDNKHKVSSFTVNTTGWTTDTSSQSGTTLYKKSVSLSHVYVSSPSVDIGTSSGTGLPTAAQQTDYNLLQYVTVDDTVPCLYLYASAIPSATFYIKVEGVD